MRQLGLVPETDPLSHLDELVAAYPPRWTAGDRVSDSP
jgi:hypothetical protein